MIGTKLRHHLALAGLSTSVELANVLDKTLKTQLILCGGEAVEFIVHPRVLVSPQALTDLFSQHLALHNNLNVWQSYRKDDDSLSLLDFELLKFMHLTLELDIRVEEYIEITEGQNNDKHHNRIS